MEELDEKKLAVVNDSLHFDMEEAAIQVNRHRLPLQIFGVAVSSVLISLLGGWLVVPAGVLVFADAWQAGLFKKLDSESFFNISPMSWGIAVEWLFIVSFPLYLIFRNKLRTKKGSTVLFVLAAAYGAIPLLLIVLRILFYMAGRQLPRV